MGHKKARTKLSAFGRSFWRGFLGHHGRPRDQAVSWHPSRIPVFHGRSAQQAFEAAYLASGGHGFRSVVNRAALTRSVMRFGHHTLCAHNSKQATINSNQAVRPMADGKPESGRHEKPGTNAGLIANIFQGSIMRTPDQHSLVRSVHKVAQEPENRENWATANGRRLNHQSEDDRALASASRASRSAFRRSRFSCKDFCAFA
jgi:hypothetical protein